MVKKKTTIKKTAIKNSTQDDNKGIIKNNANTSTDKIKDIVKSDLKNLHSKIDINAIKNIDSGKDVGKKKRDKMLKKIYPYWVYVFKDGKKINCFGVREEEINGVKLLIRTEKVNDELKVIFRELYPEPRNDPNVIDANKKRYAKELNQLKQIEKELESELFEKGETSEYNYDLSDVKIAILEKEVSLDSIKYGKSFRYFQDVRDDGIPALFYEFENNGLRLKKEVKEKSLFTEASEVKQIESLESKRDIDESLKKKDKRDWKKIAMAILWVIFTGLYMYGAIELLNYNHEREFGEAIDELDKAMVTYNKGVQGIVSTCTKSTGPIIDTMNEILKSNNEVIQVCLENNLIEGNSKPTIER